MNYKLVFTSFLLFGFSMLFAQKHSDQAQFVKDQIINENHPINEIYITDHYTSQEITHTYFKESINGIPVYNSRGAVHYKSEDNIVANIRFQKGLDKLKVEREPKLSSKEALVILANEIGIDDKGNIEVISDWKYSNKVHDLEAKNISLQKIPSQLQYFYKNGELKLVWELPVEDIRTSIYTNYLVDASTGAIVEKILWTLECNHGGDKKHSCDKNHNHEKVDIVRNFEESIMPPMPNSYKVYNWPVESPNFGDSSVVTEPWLLNTVASPSGWHTIGADDFTTTRGNNTDTYLDDDDTNSPTNGDAARAEGGSTLEFRFPLDINGNPTDYKEAAITNTFYWTNLMHDVWFNYGFDEPSGNFQEENFSASGSGSDFVNSEVQDGSGTCNANFSTPSDGNNPRMQMYLCNGRDGDFDNGVIAHEYGHGISIRLTGGPGSSGCLNNTEQMGEGWSDYFGMVMTIEPGDLSTDARGMGTWLTGEGPDGEGIRPFPYSTDFNVNPMTYGTSTQSNISVPHGVGSVWCTMIWDLTWAFIDEYGFDPDIYNGTGGNNIAMQLVIEGLKLQPCSPGFVDGRDAIIQADQILNGGMHECLIWEVFANRGLGFSADQGSTGSRTDNVEAFDMPPACTLSMKKSSTVLEAMPNEEIEYKINISNMTGDILTGIILSDTLADNVDFVSATDGGTENNGVVTWPLFDLQSEESDSVYITVKVKPNLDVTLSDIYDDMENGTAAWTITNSGSTNWSLQSSVVNSGSFAWFAPDNNTPGIATFDLAMQVGVSEDSKIYFTHQYDTEATWDGGRVFISNDSGNTWSDLGNEMIENGYNSTVYNSIPGFSGNSNGFVQTEIDLSNYSSQSVIIRFQMDCDQAVGGNGWWVDDIILTGIIPFTVNEASGTDGNLKTTVYSNSILLTPNAQDLQMTLNTTNVSCTSGGEITANVSGGTGNYSYLWEDGSTNANRVNLSPGIYSLTVSDGLDDLSKVAIVDETDVLLIETTGTDISDPNMDNGTATVTTTGGAEPFTYMWSNGENTQTISDLSQGVYYVTVEDDNDCSKMDSVVILSPFDCEENLVKFEFQLDQYPQEFSFVVKNELGEILAEEETLFDNVPDGYLYEEFICLPSGCFTIEVFDTYGDGICKNYSQPQGYVRVINVGTSEILVDVCDYDDGTIELFCIDATTLVVDVDYQDVSCEGTNDGSISSLNVSGNIGNVSYSWNTGATTESLSNLSPGLYIVTVSDDVSSLIDSTIILGSNFSMVTESDDMVTGSLRDIIATECQVDTILFDIDLTGQILQVDNGVITIKSNKTIVGPGPDLLTIDALLLSRIFDVIDGATLTIDGVTLKGGKDVIGGAFYNNNGIVILENVKFVDNQDNNGSKSWSAEPGTTITIKGNVEIDE